MRLTAPHEQLMTEGNVLLNPNNSAITPLHRGMTIISAQGVKIGTLAALVLDREKHIATHLLLCQLPKSTDYRLIPLTLVAGAQDETIQLTIHIDEFQMLEIHQSF